VNWTAVEAIGTLMASGLAFIAWRTSQETLRLSYRPVLRPVPTVTQTSIKVKNFGNGPAFAVKVVNAAQPGNVLADHQVIERLGERGEGGESNRVGNTVMNVPVTGFYTIGNRYRMFYQDISRVWHETTFDVTLAGFTIRYLGPKRWWHFRTQVPTAVKALGHFATPDELV